jgi:mannan endo-1,4-beta-mannosidase
MSNRRRFSRLIASLALVVVTLMALLEWQAAAAPGPHLRAPRRALPLVQRVQLGAFADGMQTDASRLTDWEAAVGGHAAIASYFYGFGAVFPGRTELGFAQGGTRKVLLSWDMGPTRFSEWTAGDHNGYLDQIAAAARAYPYQVYVRPWPEMNGDWSSFQPTVSGDRVNGGTYSEFRDAWRYVVTYLRNRGADNLRWVFNPDASTYAGTTPIARIWPGARYVDVLGLDGYNWGQDSGWGRWQSFSAIFAEQYTNLTALATNMPVWICETASKEPQVADGSPIDPSHSKAAWVKAMFAYQGMPRLRAIVWFDALKERDWRVTSSAGAQDAWRQGMSAAVS